MPEQTPATELRDAAELLSPDAPVYAPGTARIMKGDSGALDLIVICDQHDDPDHPPANLDREGCCRECVFVDARDAAVARQLAALINAREPLTAWLKHTARTVREHPQAADYAGLPTWQWCNGCENEDCEGLQNIGRALATAHAINRGVRGATSPAKVTDGTAGSDVR